MRPVGIGLAGLGRWGRNYAKTLLALPECRLVAVADPDPAARASFADLPGVAAHRSAAGLLLDPAVEAVVVATTDRTHWAVSVAALEAGRDVLVEKPMALSVPEAETLVSRSETRERTLAVGHTAVYSADIDALKSRLAVMPHAAGRRAIAERTSSGPTAVSSSLASAAPVGQRVLRPSSILFDLCPHDIALAILLFGTPIAARAGCRGRSVEYEIRFAAGEALEGRAEWREPPHIRRFEVTGTSSASGNGTPCPDQRDVRDTPLGRQCLDFIACCRTRREPLSNGRLGLAVVRCLVALDSSCADSGAWVQLSKEGRVASGEGRFEDTEIPASGVRA